MTVQDRIREMVSTGFTEVPLIVGTNLKNLMVLVERDLSEYEDLTKDFIKYDEQSDYYSNLWYHEKWETSIRPIISRYLDENMPVCWYKTYYTQLNDTRKS